jgi:hypothetical protein
MALDAAQIPLISRCRQLPLQIRRGDLAVSGDAMQQLNGQMHRFHTVAVVWHAGFLPWVLEHLIFGDVDCRSLRIVTARLTEGNCANSCNGRYAAWFVAFS